MSMQRLFGRKIGYLAAAALLLVPIGWLGLPGTGRSQGGKLAQMRESANLGQSNLGEIDPTSESVKLATFGLRGVAATVLWSKAHHYKKTEDWAQFDKTLGEITKVMPNSVGVWRYQAWNVSFNIASEFDDYRYRYKKVLEGIELLKQGRRYNQHAPRILWDIGWFTSQRFGRSDEREQFRRMYKEDFGEDCWLAAKSWFTEAQELAMRENLRVEGMNQVVFYSQPAMAQVYYAKALEQDGIPFEVHSMRSPSAREAAVKEILKQWQGAWQQAILDWYEGPNAFGNVDLPTGADFPVRLNDLTSHLSEQRRLWDELQQMAPEPAAALLAGVRATLSDVQRAALDLPAEQRTDVQKELVQQAIRDNVAPHAVAEKVTGERHEQARRLADGILAAAQKIQIIRFAAEPVNFAKWKINCRIGAYDPRVRAQANIDKANWSFRQGRLVDSRRYFERAFRQWDEVFREYPGALTDGIIGDDIMDLIKNYKNLLAGYLGTSFPQPFVLQRVIDLYDYEGVFPKAKQPGDEQKARLHPPEPA